MDNSYCCVPQCVSLGSHQPRTSFHRFPSVKADNGMRRLMWIAKLRIGKKVTRRMVVCGKHFKESDFFPTTAGVNGLKRRKLKRNAIPSLNLPVSSGDTDPEGPTSQKIPVGKEMTPEVNELLVFLREKIPKSVEEEEQVENETSSSEEASSCDEMYEKRNTPYITRLCVKESSKSDSENTTEQTFEEDVQNSISLSSVKCEEDSETDYSEFNFSPDDSKETLTQKLETMVSVNTVLQKEIRFYQNKCKMYEKEVNIMKGVIDNLKQINSATFDN